MLKYKNSQVGETITWFVATIQVFFIMLLFGLGVAGISLIRGNPDVESSLGFGIDKLNMTLQFMNFLETPYEGTKVSSLIQQWSTADDKSAIETKLIASMNMLIKKMNQPCYRLELFNADNKNFLYLLPSPPIDIRAPAISQVFFKPYRSEIDSFWQTGYLWDEHKKAIKVRFYLGACK